MVAEHRPPPQGRDTREIARAVLSLILLALLIAFVVDNTREVKVGFVFFDHETRLVYVFVVTAVVGMIIDRLWQRRHRRS